MEPIYVGDLVPSIASYKRLLKNIIKVYKEGEFYAQLLGGDFNYPDW